MYPALLLLHSLLRWAVLVVGSWAVLRALTGLAGPRQWTPSDRRAGRWFALVLDVQTLLGLILYGLLSPVTQAAFADMGAAMGNRQLRFWAVEHLALMVVAVSLVHVGSARARRARFDEAKHKQALVFYALALVAILLAIPWPWMAVGRPLLRLG